MPLESTMLCLDNSEWMINGDYISTRLEAQNDAASVICNDRLSSNPENTVGLLTMAGYGVDMLVSPTEEMGKILASLAKVRPGGKTNLSSSVQIAQLALKHRKNKNGGQRIILFIGSPVVDEVAKLQKLGKQLKKNNVCVDVISMGDVPDNQAKMLEFVQAANSGDTSHFIEVSPGIDPTDVLRASPVLHGFGVGFGGGTTGGDAGGGEQVQGGGGFEEYGGIDPEMDPELAMAIRVSTEEARAREETRGAPATEGAETSAGGAAGAEGASVTESSVEGATATAAVVDEGDDEEDEDELLQQALALSMIDTEEAETVSPAIETDVIASAVVPPPVPAATGDATAGSQPYLDADFVRQLLGSVDVDENDPLFQEALAQLQEGGNAPPPAPKEEEKK